MTEQNENEIKQRIATEFLRAGICAVYLDARQPGVDVPEPLRTVNPLILNFSYRYEAIGLYVNEWGIRGTLRFASLDLGSVRCAIPWAAVVALKSEVLAKAAPFAAPPEPVKTEKPKRGHLRLVS